MIREKGKVLSVKLIIFFLLLSPLPFTVPPTYAVDATPSADVKSKLKELEKEIASKAANLKQQLNKQLENKAYVGTIKTHSDSSLTLASESGAKLVNINQDTDYVSSVKNKKFSQAFLVDEMYVAALGDLDETGVLTARRIVLLPKPSESKKNYLWGKVVSMDGKLASVLDQNLKNMAVSLPRDTQLRVGDVIIATGQTNENDIFEAEFVHVIRKGATVPKKVTPQGSASPSATPKTKSATGVRKP